MTNMGCFGALLPAGPSTASRERRPPSMQDPPSPHEPPPHEPFRVPISPRVDPEAHTVLMGLFDRQVVERLAAIEEAAGDDLPCRLALLAEELALVGSYLARIEEARDDAVEALREAEWPMGRIATIAGVSDSYLSRRMIRRGARRRVIRGGGAYALVGAVAATSLAIALHGDPLSEHVSIEPDPDGGTVSVIVPSKRSSKRSSERPPGRRDVGDCWDVEQVDSERLRSI